MKFLHIDTYIDTVLEKLILLALATILFYIFYRILKDIIRHLFDNYSRINVADNARILTLSRLISSIFQYVTVFLYIYTILAIFGLPVARLLTGAGIIGVALGFAGRDLMSDIINGFFIIVEHQVNVGDTVYFQNLEVTGKVSVIGIRSLTLTSATGSLIFVPNRHIMALANLSRMTNTLYLDVPVTLDTVDQLKDRMMTVNQTYANADFVGMITIDYTVYLRSKLTGDYADISIQQAKIMTQYYEKND